MPNLSPQTVWNLKDADFTELLNSGTFKPTQNTIRFYAPSFSYYKTKHFCTSTKAFPTISVTGNACALNCGHCGGKVLQTMHSATSPEELYALGTKLKKEGAMGCLVSGGCLPDGSVPLDDFVDVLGLLKRELRLTVFVHTGIISPQTAVGLKDAGVDAALIDVIGSQQTIRKVYNLNVSVDDYANSLKAIFNAGLRVVPHVIVGLNEGKLDGEYHALELIKDIQPAALVIIAFMPIHGTAMAKTPPPSPIEIAKVAASARLMFPQTPLTLGCMRPKGAVRGETDVLALKAGVDAVAFPSDAAVEYAKTKGYKAVFSSFCCAQIYADSCK
ncbi:MAG: radical SAM protein [Candidatus Bathyarchaeota archaeon]|nr:radical SAM protein [Candidatus Bathyarchaeota archaeon]